MAAFIQRDRRPAQVERGVVARLEWRKRVEGSGEGQRLTFFNGDIATSGVSTASTPFSRRASSTAGGIKSSTTLMKDLLLEPLLDDAGGASPGRKPGILARRE